MPDVCFFWLYNVPYGSTDGKGRRREGKKSFFRPQTRLSLFWVAFKRMLLLLLQKLLLSCSEKELWKRRRKRRRRSFAEWNSLGSFSFSSFFLRPLHFFSCFFSSTPRLKRRRWVDDACSSIMASSQGKATYLGALEFTTTHELVQ